jgi:hypothetical protein
MNKHYYRDVIMEPTCTKTQSENSEQIKKQPTGDGSAEHQTEEALHDESPSKPKKKSRELAGLESSLRDAWT